MKKLIHIFIFISMLCTYSAYSQCAFDPTVIGDTILCPNTTSQLTTQTYDSYQWYRRYFLGGSAQLIPGAVQQSITINDVDDALYYFKVEATLNGCTEFSPEVLIDSWVFLLPYTIISGNYTTGPNGELILCQGDTVFLVSGLPYDTNMQWYDGGTPIPGANDDSLIVTTAGSYTFSGAPQICPNYISTQFIPSDVTVITCPTGINEDFEPSNYSIFPNPARNLIHVNSLSAGEIEIFDVTGRRVLNVNVGRNQNVAIPLETLNSGSYIIKWPDGHRAKFMRE